MSCTQPFSLLTYKTDKNFNIFKIKNFDILYIEKENMLKKLVFMGTFEEISRWVETHSKGKKFISNPLKANDTDRLDCLFAIQKPIFLALKTIEKRRKNGRDKRIIEAEKIKDYSTIAAVLASTASSYWRDHGFIKFKKS
jgi:hypothetical protein